MDSKWLKCGAFMVGKMKIAVAAAMLASVMGAPAYAHWQYTKWGMTPEQVVASSANAAHLDKGKPGDEIDGRLPEVLGDYTSGDYKFSAKFYFGQHGLDFVNMNLEDGAQCLGLRRDLDGLYGKPFAAVDRSILHAARWQDDKTQNEIQIVSIGEGGKTLCTLGYKPLLSSNSGGL